MAEKKKGKKRKEEYKDADEKPSKEEYKVAKWLRNNVPIKKTKFLNHIVEYFTASRAVDKLLESHWANGDDALFKSREDIVDFMHIMLEHKFFHRARKVPVSEQELKSKKKEKKSVESSTTDENSKEKKEKDKGTDGDNSMAEGKADAAGAKAKRKRKVKLDMHNDQRFVDGLDAYVWIYDPIPFYYWIIGTFLVLSAIGLCLFPLWPPTVRLGVYYLSVSAAGFLVFIILLVILRLIIFCLVWMCTLGNHHIWILPNLTEDVGFLPSFWPLYAYEYKGGNTDDSKKKKKKKKDKDSDNEEELEGEKKVEQIDSVPSHEKEDSKDGQEKRNDGCTEAGAVGENAAGTSESESESSQKSSTGKDFEIVDQEELYS